MKRQNLKLLKWVTGGDTGLSSEFMMATISGAFTAEVHWPHDPSDFGRCVRAYRLFELTKKDLNKMRPKHKYWRAIVDNWDEWVGLYDRDFRSAGSDELYDKMIAVIK